MTLPASSQQAIAAGRYDDVEDQWLARLEESPTDVDFFAGLAEALAASGEQERARFLLELADEHLTGDGSWQPRLRLLRAAGPLWLDSAGQHREIVASLERIYEGCPSFAGLAERVGLFRAIDDIPKIWTKVDRLCSLMAFEVGSVVWMDGNGAGRVAEVNLALECFRIDFDRQAGLTVGFGGAAKLLEPIPRGHVLHRRVTDPDGLRALRDQDPPALLREVLTSYDGGLTAGQIRDILGDLVSEAHWGAWWTAARRHPQLVATGRGSRQRYGWAASSDEAHEAIGRAFADADLEHKLALYRKHAGRDAELKGTMESALIGLADELARQNPARSFAVWVELDRQRAAPADASWSPAVFLAAAPQPVRTVLEIGDRALREQATDWIRERRSDWVEAFEELMARESDPRILDRLADALAEESPGRLEAFTDRVLGGPRKMPAALVWLGERAATGLELDPRRALKLVQQLLAAPRFRPFAELRGRLRRLYEAGGPFPHLFSRLDEALAAQAASAVERAPLDTAVRASLAEALQIRFPSLRRRTETPLYALPESIAAKRRELRRLVEEEIPANRRAIEEARELGDLRENFEYKSARQRHEYLAARSEALQRDLDRACPIEPLEGEPDAVRIGCRLELRNAGGERSLTILGPWESDPERSIISYESELAQGLLGRRPGDEVRLPEGAYTLRRVSAHGADA